MVIGVINIAAVWWELCKIGQRRGQTPGRQSWGGGNQPFTGRSDVKAFLIKNTYSVLCCSAGSSRPDGSQLVEGTCVAGGATKYHCFALLRKPSASLRQAVFEQPELEPVCTGTRHCSQKSEHSPSSVHTYIKPRSTKQKTVVAVAVAAGGLPYTNTHVTSTSVFNVPFSCR